MAADDRPNTVHTVGGPSPGGHGDGVAAQAHHQGGGSDVSVAIVGGGSAGLATAAALQRRGIRATVLERGDGVGASWRKRHEELQLNTVRWLSDLSGPRLPRTSGRWVSRDDYITYLERFTTHHGLDVRCGVQVHRVTRVDAGWRLNTSAGVIDTHHVVIATGHEQTPVRPDWPGATASAVPVHHVADHRRLSDLAGLRVLLVGAGNSGIEVAGRLVDAGVADLWLSVRGVPNILPREIAGMPLHPLTLAIRALPERVRDRAAQMISTAVFGDLTAHGLPRPPEGPYQRLRTRGVTVAIDQGFVAHLKAGRVRVVPQIERFSDDQVILRDGRTLEPDIVLTATGYRPGFRQLFSDDALEAASMVRTQTGIRAAGPSGVWFIGFDPAIEGNLRQHPAEARRIAWAISRALDRSTVAI